MKANKISINFRAISTMFSKFHLTIFIVVFVSGLAVAVIILTNIFNKSTIESTSITTSTTQTGNTNQQSTDKIMQQDKNQQYILPTGRIDPFSE
jgi:uncharacterized membrane protein YciS (DUF1049 family)